MKWYQDSIFYPIKLSKILQFGIIHYQYRKESHPAGDAGKWYNHLEHSCELGWFCPPRKHLAVTGDICGDHKWSRGLWGQVLWASQWMEARDTTQHLKMAEQSSTTKNYLAQMVNSIAVENPCPRWQLYNIA